jgi:hypothetical protein
LAVGENVLYSKEVKPESLIRRSLKKLGSIIKLQRTPLLSKIEIEKEDALQKEPIALRILANNMTGGLRHPNMEVSEGRDLLDVDETELDLGKQKHDLDKKNKNKKKSRKANQADLEATFTKSRNQLAPLKEVKVERVRANEIN